MNYLAMAHAWDDLMRNGTEEVKQALLGALQRASFDVRDAKVGIIMPPQEVELPQRDVILHCELGFAAVLGVPAGSTLAPALVAMFEGAQRQGHSFMVAMDWEGMKQGARDKKRQETMGGDNSAALRRLPPFGEMR